MVAREYVGAGGMRLHLDEPLSPEMAEQFDKGELRLAEDGEPGLDPDRNTQPQVVQHGADAPAATRVGRSVRNPEERPDVDAHPGAWATHAVRLGLLATKASTMSKAQLIDWVDAVEADGTAAVGDAGEAATGPEHASVDGRPNDARGTTAPLPLSDSSDGSTPEAKEKPAKTAKVDDWRAYAVSLGMPEEDADDSTKADLQAWVQTHEDAHADTGSQE